MERTMTARRVSTIRKIGWLGVASMLSLALLAPAANAAEGNPPSVECAGYTYYFKIDTGDLNEATYADGDADVVTNWPGQEITLSDIAEGGQTFDWSSTEAVSQVVHKEGSQEFATVYDPAVWAGSVADMSQQGISHITFCGNPVTTTTTDTTTTETTTTDTTTTETTTTDTTTTETTTTDTTETTSTTSSISVGGITFEPTVTLPPSDTLDTPSEPAGSTWRLLLIAMAGLLAAVMVLTPARVRNRR
jgi:hypothetical protein